MKLKLANTAHWHFLEGNQYQRGNQSELWHLGRQGSGFVVLRADCFELPSDLTQHIRIDTEAKSKISLPHNSYQVTSDQSHWHPAPQHCSKLFWGQLDRPVQRDLSGGWMADKRQPVDLCGPFWPYWPLYKHTNTPEGHRHQFSVYLFVLGPQPKHYLICMDGICND